MTDSEHLAETERISDIFTRIMLRITAPSLGAAEDITTSQYQALRHIAHNGPCSIGGLAHALSISQPAATMLVDRMVKRGLVRRRPSKADRRQAEVSLALGGEEILGRIEAERAGRLAGVLKLMSPSDREQFVESLERFIAAALETETPEQACLRCGAQHHGDCIVSKSRRAG